MSFLSNAHTHTAFCDGKDAPEEMLAAARALGFVSLGFTGHAYQGFDLDYCMSPSAQADYFAALRGLQAAGGTPKVYVGLEQDSLIPAAEKHRQRALCDYLIGSTHYFPVEVAGEHPAVDGDIGILRRAITECWDGDPLAMAEAYFDLHAGTVEQDLPDIIGHFDLVRKYAQQLGLDTTAPRYRKAAYAALERVRRTDAVLEVNTGAIARGYADTPYPAPFLLEAWRDLDGEVTLTSDCHDARYLDCAFDRVTAQLKALGFRQVKRLGLGDALWEDVPL